MNLPIDVYCVSFDERLYEARLIFQIMQSENDLKAILAMIKINERDYMSISENGTVENFGTSYDEIFSDNLRGKKIETYCPQWRKLQK